MSQLIAWLEPWLDHLRAGSPLGMGVAVMAGVALGLSPATYPLVPVVVGYAGGGGRITRRRAALLSLAFVLGITTVYVVLGALWSGMGMLLLDLLGRSLSLWYGLGAAALWLMGARMVGLLRFNVPLLAPSNRVAGRRGVLGAYLLGLPFGLAGCPSCAPVLLAVLIAAAASAQPAMGAAAMLAVGLGQGAVLVAAGTYGGTVTNLRRLADRRVLIERLLGVLLLLAAAYFTWQAYVM